MGDWVFCNHCCQRPSESVRVELNSCGHLVCVACKNKGKKVHSIPTVPFRPLDRHYCFALKILAPGGTCVVCKANCSCVQLSNPVSPKAARQVEYCTHSNPLFVYVACAAVRLRPNRVIAETSEGIKLKESYTLLL